MIHLLCEQSTQTHFLLVYYKVTYPSNGHIQSQLAGELNI